MDADRSTVGWHVAAKQALSEGLQIVQRRGWKGLSDLGYWEDGGYGAGSGEVDEAVEMAWQGYTS